MVTTPVVVNVANAVARQPDGKIVAAGYSGDRFALARYLSNGSFDASFGTDGIVTTSFGSSQAVIEGIALQPDGKIVAVGHQTNAGPGWAIVLARYLPDGTLDSGFGTGGLVTAAIGWSSGAYAVAVRPDGKILVTGFGDNGTVSVFALLRYNPNGSPDTGFGVGGTVTTAIGAPPGAGAYAIAIQPDGKTLLAGIASNGTYKVFALARYDSDGALDTGFGTNGTVTTLVDSYHSMITSIALQPDGKILAGGVKGPYTGGDFALARYNPDGSLDSSFGLNGIVVTDMAMAVIHSVLIQADGKIIATGFSAENPYNPISPKLVFALNRYNTDGSLDTSFGSGGMATTNFGDNRDYSYASVLQPDGKIVVVGTMGDSGFALARYLGDALSLPANIPSLSPWAVGMLSCLIAGLAGWKVRRVGAFY